MGKFDDNRFKSKTIERETPLALFNKLNGEFHFNLDVAADASNAKVSKYFDKNQNGLHQYWAGSVCWMNPPYNDLKRWVEKAYNEGLKYNTCVVALIPCRTNTNWWHELVMKAAEVRFIRGRPKFGDLPHGLPLPLAIVVFKKHDEETKFSSWELKP